MYKIKIIYLLFSILPIFLINSCNNPAGPNLIANALASPPIISGIIITGYDSPDPIGVLGKPNEKSSLPSSVFNKKSSNSPARGCQVETPFPNPADGITYIFFSLPHEAKISVWVVRGIAATEVINNYSTYSNGYFNSCYKNYTKELIKEESKLAGSYRVDWDFENDNKNSLPDGFYRVYISVNGNLMWRNIMINRNWYNEHH